MIEQKFLLRHQAAVTISYDESECSFVIEQTHWPEDQASVIVVNEWNMPDFLQNLEMVFRAYRKADE